LIDIFLAELPDPVLENDERSWRDQRRTK